MGAMATTVEEKCCEKLASLAGAVLEEDTEALVRFARGSMRSKLFIYTPGKWNCRVQTIYVDGRMTEAGEGLTFWIKVTGPQQKHQPPQYNV